MQKHLSPPHSLSLLILIFSIHSLYFTSFSQSPNPISPSSACKSALYPKLCHTIISVFRSSPSKNPYGYGQFSVKQCLKQAKKLTEVISHFLTHDQRLRLSHLEAGALDDCRQLFELNVDYLERINGELDSVETASERLVDRVLTLLSGIVTNQVTCYDGLASSGSGLASVLYAPLSDASELYSVSLGLVSHALGRTRGQKSRSRALTTQLHWVHELTWTLNKVLHRKPLNKSIKSSVGRNLEESMNGDILVNNTVTVSPYGDRNFTTISDAIAFAPNDTLPENGYFVIYAKEGYYEENVLVPKHKKNIMLLGDGMNRTVIAGNRSVIDGWTTFNSATFAVSGENFVAIDVTFKNLAGPEKHQAVAVRNNADLSTFYRCSFEGYQDTLYVHSLRQFYRECNIYGTVDFVFGNSASVFQNCNLYARKPMPDQKNAFTAQGRSDPNQNTGISIHNCMLDAAPDLAMDLNSTLTFLGRPWKPYSRTVIMQSYIGSLIDPAGWLEWNGTVGLDTLFYGEFENYGPGANTSLRVQWPGYTLMNASQAMNFTLYNFTMGDTWLPSTSIPFFGGLVLSIIFEEILFP